MSAFTEYFKDFQQSNTSDGINLEIHSCPELIDCIHRVGFLPLLDSGITGFSAEGLMAEECRFTEFADGTWQWPLWQWKGPVVTDGGCVYGKFFNSKAGFISLEWWPDFLNWRRSRHPVPEQGTIEDAILCILREHGSMIARELRAACDFTGPKMRSRFDAYISRMQMGCHIVTEDFVYPRDKHGHEYGFGWSQLTTPERLLGRDACRCYRTPAESHQRMIDHLTHILPFATAAQIEKLIK